MRHKLLRMLAFILCVSMLFAFNIHAENPGDSEIMPLWDNVGSTLCEIFCTEYGVAILRGSIASRYEGSVVYGKLTLYRVNGWPFSDTLINFWEAADYDAVDFGETYIPDDGKTYKLILEGTVTYDGHTESVYEEDTETYYANS